MGHPAGISRDSHVVRGIEGKPIGVLEIGEGRKATVSGVPRGGSIHPGHCADHKRHHVDLADRLGIAVADEEVTGRVKGELHREVQLGQRGRPAVPGEASDASPSENRQGAGGVDLIQRVRVAIRGVQVAAGIGR